VQTFLSRKQIAALVLARILPAGKEWKDPEGRFPVESSSRVFPIDDESSESSKQVEGWADMNLFAPSSGETGSTI